MIRGPLSPLYSRPHNLRPFRRRGMPWHEVPQQDMQWVRLCYRALRKMGETPQNARTKTFLVMTTPHIS